MKLSKHILVLAVVALIGCSSETAEVENRIPVIDMTDQDSIQESLKQIRASLSEQELHQLAQSLNMLMMNTMAVVEERLAEEDPVRHQQCANGEMADVNEQMECTNWLMSAVDAEMKLAMDGKTAYQLIHQYGQ
ncbi:hypothetical protein MPL1_08312 [Methylophaga lonarensis MPL]|uniref:Lipoprotein n=1 Tax=Methylophaga lonarensis MPL TaxID=1286106 RepID=M7PQZ0_9GAMM|nr:DUF6694 family lipoprotein [Methylophaga lonarensis]EMR12849.1 hypothetical protein MPL1_08312 [Methylophaga lonarensis MPL]